MRKFQQYIDGVFSDGSAQFESLEPATGQPWATMPEARTQDVNNAVSAAKRAFFAPDWADATATVRGKLLMRLADLIAENAPILAALETRDTGKIIRETSAQIAYVAAWARLKALRQGYLLATAGYDAVLAPTAAIVPPDAARLLGDHEYYTGENLLALRNTRIGNLLGLCALTLPTGVPSTGLMVMAPPRDEARLLRLGTAIERALA